ncbi:DUF3379 family protein [Pseudoalteromonas fenneropenaei]|uniref:DUF3379 family protein n=1 Tax=Pseudoalteromonas fenneropenaei TaxID=1737459 RepID=A0ABV7CN98_9GAMM
MDELEFRRRLYADPTDREVHDYAKNHPEAQAQLDDMLAFEQSLQSALQVPVPEGLAERILAHTHAAENPEPAAVVAKVSWYRRHIAPFAMAASVLIATTAYLFSATQAPVHASEYALSHIYHELGSFKRTDAISLQLVNEKLATLGAKLQDLPGKVTYVTFCDYKGKRSLHLVYQSPQGPVTVFVVPKQDSFGETAREFQDERFVGKINTGDKADTILVANLNAPIELFSDAFNQQLHWL